MDAETVLAALLWAPFGLYFCLRKRKATEAAEAITRDPGSVGDGDVVVVAAHGRERVGVVEGWGHARFRRQARIRYTDDAGDVISDWFDVSDFR